MRRVVPNLPPLIALPPPVALLLLAALTAPAAAQGITFDPSTGQPMLGFQTNPDEKPDTYRRLPYREDAGSIRIEVTAGLLYDFDAGKVPPSAADYMQQAANLIFEEAKGPVRIVCRSDRTPPAAAQKLGERCAQVIAQWLTVQEKLTRVKFTTVGASVPPPKAANPNDPFSAPGQSQSYITIDFARK
jgi:outer membrane protein OmpA-like peptidoglycan-associated protein